MSERRYLAVLAGMVAAYLATFIYFVRATIIRVPQFDMLGWVLQYADSGGRSLWSYLWMPHSDHHLVWTRLLVLIDIEWCGGTTRPFLIFDSLCWAVTLGVILWMIVGSDLLADFRTTLAAAAVLLLATSYIAAVVSVPIDGVYVHTTAFCLVALALFGPGTGATARIVALASAIAASFGVAGGLVVPYLLVWSAWRAGLRRRWIAASAASAILATAAYLPGLPFARDAGRLRAVSAAGVADFAIRFLGLPWSFPQWLTWFGRVAGLLTAALALNAIARFAFARSPLSRLERTGIAILLFTMALTVSVSMGRGQVTAAGTMPIRYAIFAALTHVALLLSYSRWLQTVWERRRVAMRWTVLCVTAAFLVQQVLAGQAMAKMSRQFTDRYAVFARGEWKPWMEIVIFPDRSAAERARQYMRNRHLYGQQ